MTRSDSTSMAAPRHPHPRTQPNNQPHALTLAVNQPWCKHKLQAQEHAPHAPARPLLARASRCTLHAAPASRCSHACRRAARGARGACGRATSGPSARPPLGPRPHTRAQMGQGPTRVRKWAARDACAKVPRPLRVHDTRAAHACWCVRVRVCVTLEGLLGRLLAQTLLPHRPEGITAANDTPRHGVCASCTIRQQTTRGHGS